MDLSDYRRAHFRSPEPEPRFAISGVGGATLYFADYERAVAYYTDVFGDPAYVEGEGTRGWRLGDGWLTLLRGGEGAPANVEIPIVVSTEDEAERLQRAFVDAGGSGGEPTDELMYDPVRACPVTDPFGTSILVYSLRTT